jgi:hypothetical protein
MCLWADVAAELDDPRSGAMLYAQLAPWKDLFGTGGPVPVHGVSLCLGRLAVLLGNPAAADRHFADSMRIHQTVRSPFGTAETAIQWGHLLLDRDRERARNLLGTALQLAGRTASVTSNGAPTRPSEPVEERARGPPLAAYRTRLDVVVVTGRLPGRGHRCEARRRRPTARHRPW